MVITGNTLSCAALVVLAFARVMPLTVWGVAFLLTGAVVVATYAGLEFRGCGAQEQRETRGGSGRAHGHPDDYVTRLSHALRGPRRPKRDLLAEARDGLLDAGARPGTRRARAAGAEQAAVREFGAVAEIVDDFQRELSAIPP